MSPSAMTAAGRGAAAAAKPAATPGHRRQLRKPVAPARARRVSGPVRARPRTRTAPTPAVLVPRAVEFVRSLPDRSLVDRLVRGRAWIPVLGVLLAGIVAMQVEVLKLGTSIGRSIERSSTLQGRNEALQANVASLSDSQRIERLAAAMGMIMPAPTAVSFLSGQSNGNARAAVANIHAPDASDFEAELPAESTPGDSSAESSGATATPDGSSTTTGADSVTDTESAATTDATSAEADGQAAIGQADAGTDSGATDAATGDATGAVGETTGAPTEATGVGDTATGDATGDAAGETVGSSAGTGAAAPVAAPPQTSSGAEG